MKYISNWIESKLNCFKIKQKLALIYCLGMILPLLITDGVIIGVLYYTEQRSVKHEMENVANAVHYSFFNEIDTAATFANSIYTSLYIDDFLHDEFESGFDFYSQYLKFFDDTLLDIALSQDEMQVTFYVDNATITNGGEFQVLSRAFDTDWYKYMKENNLKKGLFFGYKDIHGGNIGRARSLYYFQKLDFYDKSSGSVLLIEIDYSSLVEDLKTLNYDADAFICDKDNILLSNGKYASMAKTYYPVSIINKTDFEEDIQVYGTDMSIKVVGKNRNLFVILMSYLPLILALLLVNILLPFFLVDSINKSFTKRLQEVSEAFDSIKDEKLVLIENPRGKDEIGSLMHNYNRMVFKINGLIEVVYKSIIKEQEMIVARQNAELLALHSQINPHFLFNALESIRMHSLLKQETETADLVENLAKLQRQYVEWEEDNAEIVKELELVSTYLEIQKYRFGDRLSYELDVDEECENYKIPKLSIVTFVENACIHGIESKITPGWIFVRIYKKENFLYLEIEDTGNGIEEELAEELLAKMRNANMDMLKEKGRVGIINACIRLKMMTKDEVKFDLESERGIGTIVTVKIPIDTIEKL